MQKRLGLYTMFDNINTRSITFNLIAINVLLFVASYLYPALNDFLSLHYLFNKHGYIEGVGFQPYQIITHMFMHGGIAHIFFNMFALLSFGAVLERVWGEKRFLLFYLITGFGAVVLHMGVQMLIIYNATGYVDPSVQQLEAAGNVAIIEYLTRTVGASGAIFGLLTAFAMLFPNTELMLLFIPFPVKAKYFVPIYIAIELYLGIARYGGDNIAHFAHLGGALFGFILVKIWNRNRNSLY